MLAKHASIAAACTMPSFVIEPKNVRTIIGDKAKFKLTFSGNPQPGNNTETFNMPPMTLIMQKSR